MIQTTRVGTTAPGPTSVLLVEDNPVDARLIMTALYGASQYPYAITWVTQLSEALTQLQQHRFDVILLDLTLPDAEGVDAFDAVSRVSSDALILVLSASADDKEAELALARGALDTLAKPHIDSHWLPRALHYVIEQKNTEHHLRAAEEALFAEKERAQVTLNSIGDAVLTTDLQGKVTYLNAVAAKMTGWTEADALSKPLDCVFKIVNGKTGNAAPNPAQVAMDHNKVVGLAADSILVRRDGTEVYIEDSAAPIRNRSGIVVGAVIVFHDVSASRAMTLKMAHLAQHDFLTGLPNRVLLTERLSNAMAMATRHAKGLAVLFIDLDYFKNINDSLGHILGDELLKSVAARLTRCVRETDTVCRQGGDEFVILLSEIDKPDDTTLVAEKLLSAFLQPHRIEGHELHVTISIGVALYPEDGTQVNNLMQNADTAMYHAKALGRNNCQFFSPDMNTRALQRLLIETNLRRALRQDEFVLHYQPKVNLESGNMTGAEALIRWQDPLLGLVYPAEFVPIAEESGLIVPIGLWVLKEVCRQLRTWQEAGLRNVPIAVNISAIEFRHKDFLDGLKTLLRESGLPPQLLELELTEGIIMHDAEESSCLLNAIKAMGIQLAIDDFGTGYSSLSYLKRFPIDTLKIDQSFVRDIDTDESDATIVSAVISMGRSLHHRVIAEGVETIQQLDFLKAHQCEEGQGYQFSYPLTANDFERFLKTESDCLHQERVL